MLFDTPKLRKVRREVEEILHLPFCQRLLHAKARRPIVAVCLGVFLMLSGSTIAAHREYLAAIFPIHHLIFDTLGYFLHAFGAIPLLRYIEPLWSLLAGKEEEVSPVGAAAAVTAAAIITEELAENVL